jgi:gamma-glutamyltranspeptidase/glutathione hydrolase
MSVMAGRHRGVVAAGHERTAGAAAAILESGGNAFDAAVAAAWTACVAEPVLASPGGGGFLLARPEHGLPRVYDFFVQAPRVKKPLEDLDFSPADVDYGDAKQTFHVGLGSAAAPGLVRGLFRVHEDLCTAPMTRLVEPAAAMAREGVTLSEFQAFVLAAVSPIFTADARARELYGDPGREGAVAAAGSSVRLPRLADVLEVLAVEGDDLFYRGEIGRTIVDRCASGGGQLTWPDLREYRVFPREPLEIGYRDAKILTNPPPASGGLLLAFALKLLEAVDLPGCEPGSAARLDALAHAMGLTERARLEAIADSLDAPEATTLLDPGFVDAYRREVAKRAASTRGTTHISVIDARGHIASLTLSNGEGCGRIVPGTDFMLNNMLGEPDLNPRGYQRFRPGERLSSMMAPTVLGWESGRVAATGSGGANRIRAALLHVVTGLVDHGVDVAKAVEMPRIFLERGELSIEGGVDPGVVQRLCASYPAHRLWRDRNMFFGGAHTVESRAGAFAGAGDPRREGVSIVV